MRSAVFALALLLSFAVCAAPPPPPPDYVSNAAPLLTVPGQDDARIAPLFADDVMAFENGKTVAEGKASWLAWRTKDLAHYNGRTLAFSEGYAEGGGGDLLVIDTFDTVDRTHIPPTFIADPRMAMRSTLYQFGDDRRIHAVRIFRVDGFLRLPKP